MAKKTQAVQQTQLFAIPELRTKNMKIAEIPPLEINEIKMPEMPSTEINLNMSVEKHKLNLESPIKEVNLDLNVDFPNVKLPIFGEVARVKFADVDLNLGEMMGRVVDNPQRGIIPIVKEEARRRKYSKQKQTSQPDGQVKA